MNQFFGKYRAIVAAVDDPLKSGRIRVACPELFGEGLSNWCLPCIPVAGDNSGDFCIPTLWESVWIEFENGNINNPIYSGGWFSPTKTPLGDYSEDSPQRIISFGNVSFLFSPNSLRLKVGDNEVVFNAQLLDLLATLANSTEYLFSVVREDEPEV